MQSIKSNIPWPDIKTPINENNKQEVPLKEDYNFADMQYLDTPEAYQLYELQANIIVEKRCKGIVDVGCRHGPVLDFLYNKHYTDFQYMGFDTSREPISISQKKWQNFSNIEFRNVSWNNLEKISVEFDVDQVIWSGVLLYRPHDHFDFFKKITCDYYKSPNAIIQEPKSEQKYWQSSLILNTIDNDMDRYKKFCSIFNEYHLDLEIFSGKRIIMDITI